jgi:hypothetical protein
MDEAPSPYEWERVYFCCLLYLSFSLPLSPALSHKGARVLTIQGENANPRS